MRRHAFTFDHLNRMSDRRGLFEHAKGTIPRREHGYCTDDNARLLLITSRGPDAGSAHHLSRLALAFVLDAQAPDGQFHNRMDRNGTWTDTATTQDWWGRSLCALGSASVHHGDVSLRDHARQAFDNGATHRSVWPRSMAFAALGAADVLGDDPSSEVARSLLADALDAIGPILPGPWAWPEARLSYANATVAEAVIAAGAALDRPTDLERGLSMLAWLLELETAHGHLSVAPVGGRGPSDPSPMFDQQPIEVAAMADACWRAYVLTGEERWAHGISVAAFWFDGRNDSGLEMMDKQSGGGYDGLHRHSVNRNEGAESTMAFISTMQRARKFVFSS